MYKGAEIIWKITGQPIIITFKYGNVLTIDYEFQIYTLWIFSTFLSKSGQNIDHVFHEIYGFLSFLFLMHKYLCTLSAL